MAALFDKYGMVVDAGKEIFKEGEVGNAMYVIQEGSVRISKTIDGKPHTLAVMTKGEFFGEMAIVTRVKRSATATAAGTVRLLEFDRAGFVGMIEKNARVGLSIIDTLCRRLQAANAQIQVLVRRNEKGLMGQGLYYAFAEQGMEKARLDIHKTIRDIALSLEIPQEQTLGFIRKLEEVGIVSTNENVLMLTDPGRLSAIAESAGGKPIR